MHNAKTAEANIRKFRVSRTAQGHCVWSSFEPSHHGIGGSHKGVISFTLSAFLCILESSEAPEAEAAREGDKTFKLHLTVPTVHLNNRMAQNTDERTHHKTAKFIIMQLQIKTQAANRNRSYAKHTTHTLDGQVQSHLQHP